MFLTSSFSLQTSTGAIAQLGERLPCTQEVGSSILPGSTTSMLDAQTLSMSSAQRAELLCVEHFASAKYKFFNNLVRSRKAQPLGASLVDACECQQTITAKVFGVIWSSE